MFERLFKPDPDSILFRRIRFSRVPYWWRWFNLVWILWVFADPMFGNVVGRHWMVATAVSLPVFLLLYQLASMRSRRQIAYYATAMALLGFTVMPWNHSGGTCYVIYSCAYFAFHGSVRQSIAAIALTIAGFALWSHLLSWPLGVTIAMMTISISAGIGNLIYRINSQKEAELRLSHEEVRKLAATAERERIGRDLHDLLGHTLSLITLKSELADRLFDRDVSAARREIAEVERVARDALAQVRRAVTGIRTAGFAAELASAKLLLESYGVAFTYTLADVSLPADVETVLAMCVREAATNAQRHARATSVRVTLDRSDDCLVLKISDDGRGGDIVPGNGLVGMRERLAAIDADLRIQSQSGRGTTLVATLSLPPELLPAPFPHLREA